VIGPLATTSLAGVPDERPDLRLVPAAIAAWVAAGCATFVAPRVSVTVSVAAAVAALVLLRAQAVPVLAAALACAAGAGLATAARVAAVDAGPLPGLAQARATATLDLVVTADPQRLPPRVRGPGPVRTVIVVRGRVERVAARGKITRIRSPVVAFADDERWLAALPSQTVRVVGRLSAAQPHDDATALVTVHGPPTLATRPSPVQRVAERLRAGLRHAVTGLPAAERGLLPGLVIGDTAGMPPELVEDFRTAGLTHLTAVSGGNVG
jgi:competence protein ComEC